MNPSPLAPRFNALDIFKMAVQKLRCKKKDNVWTVPVSFKFIRQDIYKILSHFNLNKNVLEKVRDPAMCTKKMVS